MLMLDYSCVGVTTYTDMEYESSTTGIEVQTESLNTTTNVVTLLLFLYCMIYFSLEFHFII